MLIQNMNAKNLLIIFVIFLFLIISAACLMNWQSRNSLSVVYMSTGEVYIGNLSYFPKPILTNAYQFLPGSDGSYQLVPVSEALWAPKAMYLNSEQVIFSGPVEESSKVVQAINNKGSEPK